MKKEESLKIVEMKECRKKVNKALIFKSIESLFTVTNAWLVCKYLKDFIENGKWNDLLLSICMLYWYMCMIKESRKSTEVINNNLDTEIDLEELVEQEGLSR